MEKENKKIEFHFIFRGQGITQFSIQSNSYEKAIAEAKAIGCKVENLQSFESLEVNNEFEIEEADRIKRREEREKKEESERNKLFGYIEETINVSKKTNELLDKLLEVIKE